MTTFDGLRAMGYCGYCDGKPIAEPNTDTTWDACDDHAVDHDDTRHPSVTPWTDTPREVHDREVDQFVAETRVSPWVRRARENDLPVFDTLQGNRAYGR